MTINTLAATRDLETAGMAREQAQAIVTCIHQALENEQQSLEKTLDGERQSLENTLAAMESRIRGELYKALWVQGVGIVAVIASLLALFRFLPVG